MGFFVSWLAFKDASSDRVCAALGAERTGVFAEPLDSALMGAALPNGMYLVLADGHSDYSALGFNFADNPTLATEVLHFQCYDTVMATRIECMAEGVKRWSISREEPSGPFELEGAIPPEYHRLLAQAKAQQEEEGNDDVDYLYDVPADLGWHLTGFQHDRPDAEIRFEILKMRPDSPFAPPERRGGPRGAGARAAAHKPWWKFW